MFGFCALKHYLFRSEPSIVHISDKLSAFIYNLQKLTSSLSVADRNGDLLSSSMMMRSLSRSFSMIVGNV